jgi:hypothetical protein
MRILGLDPGLGTTGWGLIEAEGNRLAHIANGQLKTDSAEPLPKRLSHLATQLEALIADHAPASTSANMPRGWSRKPSSATAMPRKCRSTRWSRAYSLAPRSPARTPPTRSRWQSPTPITWRARGR